MCIRSLSKESGRGVGGWGGGCLHMNINLDSTNIIITGHKIVGVSSYGAFYYQHARSHLCTHQYLPPEGRGR